MNAEEVADHMEEDLGETGWTVRRLGPFLLIETHVHDRRQTFGVHIVEVK
jgi:hypothetical protein